MERGLALAQGGLAEVEAGRAEGRRREAGGGGEISGEPLLFSRIEAAAKARKGDMGAVFLARGGEAGAPHGCLHLQLKVHQRRG